MRIKQKSAKFYRKAYLLLSLVTVIVLLIVCLAQFVSKRSLEGNYENLARQKESLSEKLLQAQELAEKEIQYEELFRRETEEEYPYTQKYEDLYVTEQSKITDTPKGKKIAYLSFDDGPSGNTPKILDQLKKENVKATFFVVGQMGEDAKPILKRIVEEGHTIGIHSYSHKYEKIYESVDAYLEDFHKMFQMVYEATGVKPTVFRFPGGSVNAHNRMIYQQIISEMIRRGVSYYDWTVDSQDATRNPSVQKMLQNINASIGRQTRPVVLMHDAQTKKMTVEALPKIIKAYRDGGYSFDTLDHRDICFFPYQAEPGIPGK